MTITALPVLNRTDSTFKADVDTFFGTELPQFSVEAEAARVEINANTATASDAAVSASNQVTLATIQAQAAAGSALVAGAVVWVSGTTYAVGDARYSPINLQTYRRKIAGAGTTDPSLDATNWAKAVDALPVQTGNAGKFLTTNGTAESWGAVPASGLTLLATLTPTAAANVDALNVFSSAYDSYLVQVLGVKPSARQSLYFRFATSGVVDSGSSYAVAITTPGASSVTSYGLIAPVTDNVGTGLTTSVSILNVNNTASIKTANAQGFADDNLNGAYKASSAHTGYFAANVVSGIRFFWESGANFAAQGTILIYGYAK